MQFRAHSSERRQVPGHLATSNLLQIRYALAIVAIIALSFENLTMKTSDIYPQILLSQQRKHVKTDEHGIKQCGNILRIAMLDWNRQSVPIDDRVIILYHVGFLTGNDSLEMNSGNIRLFMSSFAKNKLKNSTFLIVNISGGVHNPLKGVVDAFLEHIKPSCSLMWSSTKSDLLTHALTLATLAPSKLTFGAVIGLNNGVRGPLARRETWIADFTDLLNETTLVGSVISCEYEPHVQTHMFAFGATFTNRFLEIELFSKKGETWVQLIQRSEIGLSRSILSSGMKMGSMLHKRRWGESFFNGSCRPELGTMNPTGWCEQYYEDSIFIKFGGEFYRDGLYCRTVLESIETVSRNILSTEQGDLFN